jgi:hypothetical protein
MATRDLPSHPVEPQEEGEQHKGVLGKIKETLGLKGSTEGKSATETVKESAQSVKEKVAGPGTPGRGAGREAAPVCAASEVMRGSRGADT